MTDHNQEIILFIIWIHVHVNVLRSSTMQLSFLQFEVRKKVSSMVTQRSSDYQVQEASLII